MRIKLNATRILFCSDFHFGHDREFLYHARGFSNIQEHNDWIIDMWNKIVDEETIVINLGDLCFFDQNSIKFDMLAALKCKEHYVLNGNHTSGMKQAYQREKERLGFSHFSDCYPLKYKNVTFCGDYLNLSINNQRIICCHFPIAIWDQVDKGSWHLCGHSHGSYFNTSFDSGYGKCIDVGVDNCIRYNKTPFLSLDEVNYIMSNKTLLKEDHHDDELR